MSLVSARRSFALALKGSPNVAHHAVHFPLQLCPVRAADLCVGSVPKGCVLDEHSVGVGRLLRRLTCAVLSGVVADKVGRNVVIRTAAVLMLLASAGLSVGILFEHYASVIVAASGAGAAYGASFPVVEALFADPVAAGHRTEVYSVKYSLETASGLLGVLVALVMFAAMGDEWAVETMKVVIWSGLGLTALCSLLLWTVRSELALEQLDIDIDNAGQRPRMMPMSVPKWDSTRAVKRKVKLTIARALLVNTETGHNHEDGEDEHEERVISSGAVNATTVGSERPLGGGADAAAVQNASLREDGYDPQHCGFLHTPLHFTPHLFGIFGVLLCLGNGMTMMYFNLFLISTFDASPVEIQVLNGSGFVMNVIFGQILALAHSRGWNRFKIQVPLGVTMMVGIGLLAAVSSGPLAQMWPTFVISMIRVASVKAPTGIIRALLMDTVPKAQRGRWNAMESLMTATWTASAVVGGYIADAASYRRAFMITCVFHGVGFCVLMLMFRNRDPREWLRQEQSIDRQDNDA